MQWSHAKCDPIITEIVIKYYKFKREKRFQNKQEMRWSKFCSTLYVYLSGRLNKLCWHLSLSLSMACGSWKSPLKNISYLYTCGKMAVTKIMDMPLSWAYAPLNFSYITMCKQLDMQSFYAVRKCWRDVVFMATKQWYLSCFPGEILTANEVPKWFMASTVSM